MRRLQDEKTRQARRWLPLPLGCIYCNRQRATAGGQQENRSRWPSLQDVASAFEIQANSGGEVMLPWTGPARLALRLREFSAHRARNHNQSMALSGHATRHPCRDSRLWSSVFRSFLSLTSSDALLLSSDAGAASSTVLRVWSNCSVLCTQTSSRNQLLAD